MPVVRTDGRSLDRSVYGHVITKFSLMGRLPHFLSYGTPPTRALRARVELRYYPCFPPPRFEIACKNILEKELNPTFKHGFFVSIHHLPFSMALKRKLGYC